jgi:hypothetical protein
VLGAVRRRAFMKGREGERIGEGRTVLVGGAAKSRAQNGFDGLKTLHVGCFPSSGRERLFA